MQYSNGTCMLTGSDGQAGGADQYERIARWLALSSALDGLADRPQTPTPESAPE